MKKSLSPVRVSNRSRTLVEHYFIYTILAKKSTPTREIRNFYAKIKKTMNHKPGSVAKSLSLWLSAIYLGPALRTVSSSLPAALDGPPCCCLTLLLMRFAFSRHVATAEVGSYPAISPFPPLANAASNLPVSQKRRYTFCCTFCRKAVAGPPPGCYPASCPAEPGLSSPGFLKKAKRRQPGSSYTYSS